MICLLYSICIFSGALKGRLHLTQLKDYVRIEGYISGISPEGDHGFHVHQNGNLSNNCTAAGPHFNPENRTHGGPINNGMNDNRHAGDEGNIKVDAYGHAKIFIKDYLISLKGSVNNVNGRSIVVHAKPDDLGLGGNADSLLTGNSGQRLDCCIITPRGSRVLAKPKKQRKHAH